MAEPFTAEDCVARAQHLIGVHTHTLQQAANDYPDSIDLAKVDASIRELLDISHKLKNRKAAKLIPVLAGPMGRVTNAPA